MVCSDPIHRVDAAQEHLDRMNAVTTNTPGGLWRTTHRPRYGLVEVEFHEIGGIQRQGKLDGVFSAALEGENALMD